GESRDRKDRRPGAEPAAVGAVVDEAAVIAGIQVDEGAREAFGDPDGERLAASGRLAGGREAEEQRVLDDLHVHAVQGLRHTDPVRVEQVRRRVVDRLHVDEQVGARRLRLAGVDSAAHALYPDEVREGYAGAGL